MMHLKKSFMAFSVLAVIIIIGLTAINLQVIEMMKVKNINEQVKSEIVENIINSKAVKIGKYAVVGLEQLPYWICI